MKRRLLLSCVSCLLALGLVSACNNDDEVDLNEDDGTTQNDGGGSDGTTQGGGSGDTETVTLSNYTLRFTFTYGSATETVPDYATAYFAYGKVGESWTELTPLTATSSGAYTITLASVEATTYEYLVVLDYTGTTNPGWDHKTTSANQSFTVEASHGDGHIENITIACDMSLTDLIIEPNIPARTNYTLAFTFLDESGNATTLSDSKSLYISGDWNGWSITDVCTLEGTTYSLTIDEISVGTHTFKGLACASTPTAWGDCDEVISGTYDNSGNAVFTVSASDSEDGHTQQFTVESTGYLTGDAPAYTEDHEVDVTVAIKLTGTRTTDITTWHAAGFDWSNIGKDQDGSDIISDTMTSAETGSDYNYYYNFGEQSIYTNYTFNVIPDPYKWTSNLGSLALAPTNDLKTVLDAVTDDSALGLKATQYVEGTAADYSDYVYVEWELNLYDLVDHSALVNAESLLIVLDVDYANVANSDWSSPNNVVTGVSLIIDSETYYTAPTSTSE